MRVSADTFYQVPTFYQVEFDNDNKNDSDI